jgi:hypothetical protein
VARNGKQQPARPRIELRRPAGSLEEAAAITAAIEQFLRDTAPPPAAPAPAASPWLRSGLLEARGLRASSPSPWGDPEAWGSLRDA